MKNKKALDQEAGQVEKSLWSLDGRGRDVESDEIKASIQSYVNRKMERREEKKKNFHSALPVFLN